MRPEAGDLYIRFLDMTDVQAHYELRLRNRKFLTPFEPAMTDDHFTMEAQRDLIAQYVKDREEGTRYSFGIFLRDTDELIGRITLSNVVRGIWQNATIGYFLDEAHNGKGCTTAAFRLVLDYAFGTLRLHRVQAGVMPCNTPSIRVVEKVGMRFEGCALRYLQINGVWEDHNLYAITAEEWPLS